MASREAVEQAYSLLGTTRPGADLDKIDIGACAMVLDPIPDEVLLSAAMAESRKGGDFLPSAGTLFQASLDIMDTEISADDAWALVEKHSRNASLRDNNPVKLPDRAARALELIGGDIGWRLDEMPFRRKEFLEVYGRLRQSWRDQAALPAGQAWKQLNG